MSSVVQGFTKSLAMTVLSEIGDKTFFAAVILAMRNPRMLVLSGCLSALIVSVPVLPCLFKLMRIGNLMQENIKKKTKAFSVICFGEWGDKIQIATIGLATDENPFGVFLGGIFGQALCTTAAVVGGKSLVSQISERMVALSGGVLFIVFRIQSFLSTAGQ